MNGPAACAAVPVAGAEIALTAPAGTNTLPASLNLFPPAMNYTLNVNGRTQTVEAEPDTPMLWVLRDHLNYTGVKYGCGVDVCGACTVHVDGESMRSCQIPISEAAGKKFVTIEGLSANGDHPLQKAWCDHDVAQCGYCQAGQIMTAAALLRRTPKPTDADIDKSMSDNLCRCGTYTRIRAAIHTAAAEMAAK